MEWWSRSPAAKPAAHPSAFCLTATNDRLGSIGPMLSSMTPRQKADDCKPKGHAVPGLLNLQLTKSPSRGARDSDPVNSRDKRVFAADFAQSVSSWPQLRITRGKKCQSNGGLSLRHWRAPCSRSKPKNGSSALQSAGGGDYRYLQF